MKNINITLCIFLVSLFTTNSEAKSPWLECGKEQSKLTGEISNWGEVKCTKFGELITAKNGWVWSLPGGYKPIYLPAFSNEPTKELQDKYRKFKSIKFSIISNSESKTALSEFRSYFSGASDTKPSIYKLTMLKASNDKIEVYFFKSKYNEIWGFTRTPEWKPNHPFMVINREK